MTSGYPDWLRAFLLLGKHDSDYLPILLGADGSMYAVLQGEYEGALRTVALDDQGRISAYVTDTSDAWQQTMQIGNTELAVRLGSIVRLDRRGTVMFLDGFEDGSSRWEIRSFGDGGLHSLTPLKAFSGGYSLRLTAPTGTPYWEHASSIVPTCLVTSVGISVMFRSQTLYDHITVFLDIYDGAYLHELDAQLIYSTHKIVVDDELGNSVEVGNYDVDIGDHAGFHLLKLVCNISTDKHIRLLYDNKEYDISAIGLSKSAYVATPKVYIGISLWGVAGQPASVVDFDDVIVTSEA